MAGIGEIVCIKPEVYFQDSQREKAVPFLEEVLNTLAKIKSLPPAALVPTDSMCSFVVTRGTTNTPVPGQQGDGYIHFFVTRPHYPPMVTLTESGDTYLYSGSSDTMPDPATASKEPPKWKIPQQVARGLFKTFFGRHEFTPKVRTEICGADGKKCPDPSKK